MQKFIVAIASDGQATIKGQDAVHLSRVLRLSPGDRVAMTDGNGTDYEGKILSVSPKAVEVAITAQKPSQTESFLDLTICSAMLKDKKMDHVIRELTQIGITRWVPFFSGRSIPRPDPKKLARRHERWISIADESLKQCRRSRRVDIARPLPFEAVMQMAEDADLCLAFWEGSGRSMVPALKPEENAPSEKVLVLIGPEGGFEEKEIETARAKGFVSCSLGPRILRAETAAIAAAVLVQYLFGDLAARPPAA